MKTRPFSRIALACAAMLFATTAGAQSGHRVVPVPQPARQAPPVGVATFGMPSPSGLPSPVPAGLTPPTAPSLTPPTSYNLSNPGTPPGSPAIDAGIAQPLAGGGGGGVVAGPPQTNVMGAAGAGFGGGAFAAVDLARSFIQADANRDGELTRSEARRLAIVPMSFEEMDRNFDGLISRFEYEDATR